MQPKANNRSHELLSQEISSPAKSISDNQKRTNGQRPVAPAMKDEKMPNMKINVILAKLPQIILAIVKQHSQYLKLEENKNTSEEESKNWSEFNLALKKKETRTVVVKNWLEELEKTVARSGKPNGMIELLDSIQNLKATLTAHCLSVLPAESQQLIQLEVDEQVSILWSKLKEVLDWLSSYLKTVNDQQNFRLIEALFIDLVPGLGVRVKLDQQHSFYLMRLLKVKAQYGWSIQFVQNWSSLKKEMQSMGTVADTVNMWIQGSKNYFQMSQRLNEINRSRDGLRKAEKKEEKSECGESGSKVEGIGVENSQEESYPYFELNQQDLEKGGQKRQNKQTLKKVIDFDTPKKSLIEDCSQQQKRDQSQIPLLQENGKSFQREQEKQSLNEQHECVGFKIQLSDELHKNSVSEKSKMDEIEQQKMALRQKVKKNEAHLRSLIQAKNLEKKSEVLLQNRQNVNKNTANNKMKAMYEKRMNFLHYFRSIMKYQNSVKLETQIEIAKVLIMAQKLFVKSILRQVIKLAKVNCERFHSNTIGDEFRYYSKENMQPNVYFWGSQEIKEANIVKPQKVEGKEVLTFGSAGIEVKNEQKKQKKFTKLCYPDKLQNFFRLKYDEYKKQLEELEKIKKQLKQPNYSKKIPSNAAKYLTDQSTRECKDMVVLEGGCLSKRLKITANVVTEIILKHYGWMFAAEKCFYRNN